jgi:rRNA maturation RNase YbeY
MTAGFTNLVGATKFSLAQQTVLRAVIEKARQQLGLKTFDLTLAFCSRKRIQELNRLYRNKDKVTDVLSFFYPHEGEIFICRPQAAQQAKENGLSLLTEVIQLLIHGLVHVAGYDHETESDYRAMRLVEEKIYAAFQKNH